MLLIQCRYIVTVSLLVDETGRHIPDQNYCPVPTLIFRCLFAFGFLFVGLFVFFGSCCICLKCYQLCFVITITISLDTDVLFKIPRGNQ